MSRAFLWGVAAAALLLTATPSSAAPLLGAQVTGSLDFGFGLNFYDPVNGLVPPACLNTVPGATVTVFDPGTEFCYFDGATIVTADFTDNTITLANQAFFLGSNGWMQVFESPAFVGLTFVKIMDTFTNGGVTLVQSGNALTFDWGGDVDVIGLFTAVYALRPVVAAPEPATLSLLGAGLVAWRVRARRRGARA